MNDTRKGYSGYRKLLIPIRMYIQSHQSNKNKKKTEAKLCLKAGEQNFYSICSKFHGVLTRSNRKRLIL